MARQQDIDALHYEVLLEQEAAAQELRTPNIPLLDEIGFSVIEQRALVMCDTMYVAVMQKGTDGMYMHLGNEIPKRPILGYFGGFSVVNVAANDNTPDTSIVESAQKRVVITLTDTYDASKAYLSPVDVSALKDPLSTDAGKDPRLVDLLRTVIDRNITLDQLELLENSVRRKRVNLKEMNTILNAFVRPSDLFRTIFVGSYSQPMFKDRSDYLRLCLPLEVAITDRHRFIIGSIAYHNPESILVEEDAEPEYAEQDNEIYIHDPDYKMQVFSVSSILGYITRDRVVLPDTYDVSLRNPLC